MKDQANTTQIVKVLIEVADNKVLNGKTFNYNIEKDIAIIGRTEYKIGFGVHQPNIKDGDYSVIDHTIFTAPYFTIYRTDTDHMNKGKFIRKFSIELNN